MPTSTDILRDLLEFDTTSRNPNHALIDYLAHLLKGAGAQVQIIENEDGSKANLYATIGPRERAGVLLSGHTDVVPVDGQDWTVPPFALTKRDGRLFGRGSTDMKGFVASAVATAMRAARLDLKTPLHLAFSYDEEIGCIGVRSLIDMLSRAPFRPGICIIGEPTELAVAVGHKGKIGGRITCRGIEGHSALAPKALNAIYLATDMVGVIRDLQDAIASGDSSDTDYDVPYTTLHVGRIAGGVALNIVPNLATVDFEIRNIATDDADAILGRVRDAAEAVVKPHLTAHPKASITIDVFNRYPGLDTDPADPAVAFVKSLAQANGTFKVAFGTEGGLFSQALGIPTVVCGPGSMAQGHKPDEYLEKAQLDACDAMLERLIQRLIAGVQLDA